MNFTNDMTGMLTTMALGAHLHNQQRQMHHAVDRSDRAVTTLSHAMTALRRERAENAKLRKELARARGHVAALQLALDGDYDA